MPARRDLEPTEIPALLPYLTLIDRVQGRFRYRLVGTALSEELGRELTGSYVGSHAKPPEYATAIRALYQGVFATGRPVFTTGEYRSPSRAVHAVSRLMLPLSDDGGSVNMVMFTRIARFNRNARAGVDWLQGAPGKVCETIEIGSLAEVEAQDLDWECQCLAGETAA